MKNLSLIFAALCVAFCSSYFACKQSPVQPTTPHNPLNVRAVLVSPVQVVLNWSNPANAANTYQLLRNGTVITRDTVPPADTMGMYKDSSTLVPGTMYTYILSRLVSGAPYDSDTLQVRTLDTTKDNYSWTINKIGEANSVLHGVWGASPNSVWACGGGVVDSGARKIPFGIMHYVNGQMTFYRSDGDSGVGYPTGCYGLSDSEIWFAEPGNLIEFKKGKYIDYPFTGIDASLPTFTGNLNAVWEAADSEIFAVGDSGIVMHRKPDMTWEIQHAPTTLSLLAMKGFSASEIYAVCKDRSCTGCGGNILKYDGTSWNFIATSIGAPGDSLHIDGDFFDIGGQNHDSLYTVGYRIYKRDSSGWMLTNAPCNDLNNQTCSYYTEGVDGSWNNVWIVGAYGRVFHFGGAHWSANYPFLNTGSNLTFDRVVVFPNDIFIVGADDNSAWFIHGQ